MPTATGKANITGYSHPRTNVKCPRTSSVMISTIHPRRIRSLAGTRYDVPIGELFTMVESAPTDTGNYQSRVLSVQQTEDAAVAVVAEEGCWGTVSFIDYFLLARIDGVWKIVSKLFAHTGGKLPERI